MLRVVWRLRLGLAVSGCDAGGNGALENSGGCDAPSFLERVRGLPVAVTSSPGGSATPSLLTVKGTTASCRGSGRCSKVSTALLGRNHSCAASTVVQAGRGYQLQRRPSLNIVGGRARGLPLLFPLSSPVGVLDIAKARERGLGVDTILTILGALQGRPGGHSRGPTRIRQLQRDHPRVKSVALRPRAAEAPWLATL